MEEEFYELAKKFIDMYNKKHYSHLDDVEICTYVKDNLCRLLDDGGIRICNGKCSDNINKCRFYIGLRNLNK